MNDLMRKTKYGSAIRRKMYAAGLALLVLLSAAPLAFAVTNKNVYGIAGETYTGMKLDVLNPSDSDGGYMGAWGAATMSVEYSTWTEGGQCTKVVVASGQNGGMWVQFGFNGTTNPEVITDMSAYSGGSLEFDIMMVDVVDVEAKVTWNGGAGNATRNLNGHLGVPIDGKWHHVSIPLSQFTGIALAQIKQPVVLSALWGTGGGTYYFDNVYWKKAPSGAVTVSLKNISDGSAADNITWSDVVSGETQWKASGQYFEIIQDYAQQGWGLQIYTDNKHVSLSTPCFSGTGDPAGLVDENDSSKRLPMCWRVVDSSTNTLTIVQSGPGLHSAELDPTYNCWLWMKDRNTPAPAGFADGEDYVRIWDTRGIQHGEGAWGGCLSPNYVYLGADFTEAVTPGAYSTNRLRVELFYE